MLRFVVVGFVLMLASTACAPSSPGGAPAAQPAEAVRPAAPKRIVAAIRGDPKTLSESINTAAGGSSSAGVRELEPLVNAGLLNMDPKGVLQPLLAQAAPTIENGQWKLNQLCPWGFWGLSAIIEHRPARRRATWPAG